MKIKTFWLLAILSLMLVDSVFAGSKTKEELAQSSVSADSAESTEAIKNLRAMGKDGLDALFQTYSAEIAKFSASGVSDDEWKRIAFALNRPHLCQRTH